jgi:hypothetical protein
VHAPRRKESVQTRWVPFLAAASVALAVGSAGASCAANTFPVATVTYPTTVPAPTPEQIAAALRKGALRRCETGYYGECQDWLDAAKNLDPKGAGLPEVQAARADIAQAATRGNHHPDDDIHGKPRSGPRERPLQPPH